MTTFWPLRWRVACEPGMRRRSGAGGGGGTIAGPRLFFQPLPFLSEPPVEELPAAGRHLAAWHSPGIAMPSSPPYPAAAHQLQTCLPANGLCSCGRGWWRCGGVCGHWLTWRLCRSSHQLSQLHTWNAVEVSAHILTTLTFRPTNDALLTTACWGHGGPRVWLSSAAQWSRRWSLFCWAARSPLWTGSRCQARPPLPPSPATHAPWPPEEPTTDGKNKYQPRRISASTAIVDHAGTTL